MAKFLRNALKAMAATMVFLTAPALAAESKSVRLKPSISVDSSDVRIGDLFENAGEAGLAVFGPAPTPGKSQAYSANYIQAKAKQAGLDWSNEENTQTVIIIRRGGPASKPATPKIETAQTGDSKTPASKNANAPGAPDLKRGDMVQIIYRAPGIELVVAGKATADASIGGKARAVNARSNKAVDGVLASSGHIEVYSLDNAQPAQVAALDGISQ